LFDGGVPWTLRIPLGFVVGGDLEADDVEAVGKVEVIQCH